MTLTADRAREVLAYDAGTGVLTWRLNRGRAIAGVRAGCCDGRGYRLVSVFGKQYWEHRLVWLLCRGVWPQREIDHINGVRDDNRITNLRLVTRQQQNMNKSPEAATVSGRTGVHFDKSRGNWMAYIGLNGRTKRLGRFKDAESAIAARKSAEAALFGQYARGAA